MTYLDNLKLKRKDRASTINFIYSCSKINTETIKKGLETYACWYIIGFAKNDTIEGMAKAKKAGCKWGNLFNSDSKYTVYKCEKPDQVLHDYLNWTM